MPLFVRFAGGETEAQSGEATCTWSHSWAPTSRRLCCRHRHHSVTVLRPSPGGRGTLETWGGASRFSLLVLVVDFPPWLPSGTVVLAQALTPQTLPKLCCPGPWGQPHAGMWGAPVCEAASSPAAGLCEYSRGSDRVKVRRGDGVRGGVSSSGMGCRELWCVSGRDAVVQTGWVGGKDPGPVRT